tara:strand:- start:7 stop:753 length:747 start_codon:yes stop_codon:yes gene_type:complete
MEPFVKHYREGPVGILEFGNLAGNSLSSKLLEQMSHQLQLLEAETEVKVILLQSIGSKAFCGGASFSEMKTLRTEKDATAFFMGFANVINTIRSLSKFLVARVHGKVVGGGVGIVAACDYILANKNAGVKLSELSIGIGPYVIEPALSRKIGNTAFAQLSLEAENWKSAEWAAEKGLYTIIASSEEQLNQLVDETVKKFARYSQKATKDLRNLHWKNTDHWHTLLPGNAKITARLLLQDEAQQIIKTL